MQEGLDRNRQIDRPQVGGQRTEVALAALDGVGQPGVSDATARDLHLGIADGDTDTTDRQLLGHGLAEALVAADADLERRMHVDLAHFLPRLLLAQSGSWILHTSSAEPRGETPGSVDLPTPVIPAGAARAHVYYR